MIVLELDKVEIDHCHLCGGIWLDAGELELLLESSSDGDKLLDSFRSTDSDREQKKRCPICRKKMAKISLVADREIILDKCRLDHGFWFDRGELNYLLEKGGITTDSQVYKLLNNLFKEDS